MRGFLSDCHQIERLAGEIYQHLADDCDYAPSVRALFQKLAMDEWDHSRQLDLAMQIPSKELNAVSRIAWERVDAALQLAKRMLAEVSGRRFSEEEALRLAVQIEEQFVRVHVDNALHFDDRRVAALFEGLARSDQAHLDTLREGLARWHRERKASK